MPGLPSARDQTTHGGNQSPDAMRLPPTNRAVSREHHASSGERVARTKQSAMPDSPVPFEQVLTSSKGRGMIATQDIKRGTQIISEEAILHIEDGNDDMEVLAKILHLSQSKHEQLTDLSRAKGEVSPKLCATLATELEEHHQYSGRYLNAAIRDLVKIHSNFYENAIMMSPKGQFGVGIFPTYSSLNHSCTPNVQRSYNATIGRSVVHTIRDIKVSEEILTSDIPLRRSSALRKEDLYEKWAFECQCDTCSEKNGGAGDIRRRRLSVIDQGVAFLNKTVDRMTFGGMMMHGMIPKTESECLRWAEESVGLLKVEGLVGMDMAKAYRTCSQYSLQEGQLEKALGYARKELEVQVVCLGPDTACLLPGDDANAWIKHIENMSEADKVRMRMNEKRVQKEQKKIDRKAAKKAAKQ